jgi:Tol biopolymer transport system component
MRARIERPLTTVAAEDCSRDWKGQTAVSGPTGTTYTQKVKRPLSLVVAASVLVAFALVASDHGVAGQPGAEHRVDDHSASFSPDGRTIIFERFFSTLRRGVDTHPVSRRAVLLVMRADGSHKRVLRHVGATFERDATFSSDGRSIVFIRDGRIFLMRRDGSGAHPVGRDFREHACPRFSPDGTKISFWRGTSKSGAYFVMNADGSAVRRISGGHRFAWGCPFWFPDGTRLVIAKEFKLYVASVDGTRIQRITDDKDGTLYRPSVSPDGRWIACDGWHRRTGYGIIVMRTDGTGMRRITTAANEIENDAAPSWSPDGRRIVFSGYRSRFRGAGVYVVKLDGRGLRRLSNFVG